MVMSILVCDELKVFLTIFLLVIGKRIISMKCSFIFYKYTNEKTFKTIYNSSYNLRFFWGGGEFCLAMRL